MGLSRSGSKMRSRVKNGVEQCWCRGGATESGSEKNGVELVSLAQETTWWNKERMADREAGLSECHRELRNGGGWTGRDESQESEESQSGRVWSCWRKVARTRSTFRRERVWAVRTWAARRLEDK